MWQVHGMKAVALTRGGLVGDRKEAVTTNDEKSAEAIVGASRRAEQSTQTKNRKVFHAKKPESGGNSP
jgi:hypothetical protein